MGQRAPEERNSLTLGVPSVPPTAPEERHSLTVAVPSIPPTAPEERHSLTVAVPSVPPTSPKERCSPRWVDPQLPLQSKREARCTNDLLPYKIAGGWERRLQIPLLGSRRPRCGSIRWSPILSEKAQRLHPRARDMEEARHTQRPA